MTINPFKSTAKTQIAQVRERERWRDEERGGGGRTTDERQPATGRREERGAPLLNEGRISLLLWPKPITLPCVCVCGPYSPWQRGNRTFPLWVCRGCLRQSQPARRRALHKHCCPGLSATLYHSNLVLVFFTLLYHGTHTHTHTHTPISETFLCGLTFRERGVMAAKSTPDLNNVPLTTNTQPRLVNTRTTSTQRMPKHQLPDNFYTSSEQHDQALTRPESEGNTTKFEGW